MPAAAPIAASVAGSVISGAMSKKGSKAVESVPTSGFGALPQPVQDAWLKTYLPAVTAQYERGYQAPPMERVSAPTTIFDSPELYKMQQYSDAMGGMFTPTNKAAEEQKPATKTPSPLDAINKQVMDKHGMNLADYIATRPDVLGALGGNNPKFTQHYGTGAPDSEAAQAWWTNWGMKGY